mgnify:CR=1 FL=1
MDKLNISTFPGCVKKTLEYIKTALKALHVSAADSEALLGSAGEIISAICAADANGSVIVSAEKSAKGCCVQFMHLGALFNPCPKAPDSITQKCMDEISFEFKYGRNVLSVFRRANSDKNIQEVKEMKEIQIRNHSIKPGDKIAVINEHSKADILARAEALANDDSFAAVEWRIDNYDDVFEIRFVIMPETIAEVRKALGDKVLMYTFRDKRIGGAHPTTCMYHSRLNNLAIDSGAGDIITVEWYDELDAAISNVENAHKGGKVVVASWCTDGKLCAECVQHKLVGALGAALGRMVGSLTLGKKKYADVQAEMLELGAVCADEETKASLDAGIAAFKAKHADVLVIRSVITADGSEEKTVF